MSHVAKIRSTSGTGCIRTLEAGEVHLLREHLLRLEPQSRHDRFNGSISEEFVKTYASRCFGDGTIVIAYLQDGVVHGAAELHAPQRSLDGVPEIAFSVEKRVRRQGVGSALFEQLLTEARNRDYDTLRITTGGENQAMKALAYKFGAHLSFRQGEATGTVDLNRTPVVASAHGELLPYPGVRSNPALVIMREHMRSVQTAWGLFFRVYADMLQGNHHMGMR